MSDVECPYCGAEIEICHDDGFGYEEGVKHEYECHACRKAFVFYTNISFDYEAEKADCLNDDKHQWKPSSTFPQWHTRMQCSTCDAQREATPEEKVKYKIPERPL